MTLIYQYECSFIVIVQILIEYLVAYGMDLCWYVPVEDSIGFILYHILFDEIFECFSSWCHLKYLRVSSINRCHHIVHSHMLLISNKLNTLYMISKFFYISQIIYTAILVVIKIWHYFSIGKLLKWVVGINYLFLASVCQRLKSMAVEEYGYWRVCQRLKSMAIEEYVND